MSKTGLRNAVWGISVLAYVLAVVNRSSFTALGTTAQQHFGAEATIVSTFVMVQLVLYALAQIPVGILLDKFGPTRIMAAGLTLMAVGQLSMGLTDSIPLAILARVLVGAGDACIFVSMIRMIADWFVPKYIPTLNQVSGTIGQMGQLLAVAPLTAAVAIWGWASTFAGLAILSIFFAVLMVTLVRDTPSSVSPLGKLLGRKSQEPGPQLAEEESAEVSSPITVALPVLGNGARGVFSAIKSLLKRPGIRLAFWVHMCTSFANHVFVLLWGVPYMTGGLGYSTSTAQFLISVFIGTLIVFGLFAGPIFSRVARVRVEYVLVFSVLNMLVLALAFFWPGGAPSWWIFICMMMLGIGGPTSMLAFEITRTHSPVSQLGIATGIANMGGFTGGLTGILLVGITLDLLGAGTPSTYNLEAFRWAMASILPIFLISISAVVVERPKAIAYLKSKGLR